MGDFIFYLSYNGDCSSSGPIVTWAPSPPKLTAHPSAQLEAVSFTRALGSVSGAQLEYRESSSEHGQWHPGGDIEKANGNKGLELKREVWVVERWPNHCANHPQNTDNNTAYFISLFKD